MSKNCSCLLRQVCAAGTGSASSESEHPVRLPPLNAVVNALVGVDNGERVARPVHVLLVVVVVDAKPCRH